MLRNTLNNDVVVLYRIMAAFGMDRFPPNVIAWRQRRSVISEWIDLIYLAQSPQRARRRFVDCCAPKNDCPCATHFRLYFTLPTSLFLLRMSHAEARRRGGVLLIAVRRRMPVYALRTSDFTLPTSYGTL